MTKNLKFAAVGDKIIKFGNVELDAPAEVVEVLSTSYGVHAIKVRVADGRMTQYPAAGALGMKQIVVAA